MEFLDDTPLPTGFADVEALEEFLSRPTRATAAVIDRLEGDFIVLGVAGKMGVTLVRLIKRCAPDRRVVGVARFSKPGVRERLEEWGVETIECDLLDPASVAMLPQLPNVIYLAGLKFDFRGREAFLWAMNTLAPANVAEQFRASRIVSLSSIHVYPWSNPLHGGVTEDVHPVAQPGEYANSVVGRERIFQYFSEKYSTPGSIVRFVYAIEPRYGVFQEIASAVRAGRPVELATGSVNVMWQGDAINHFLQLLEHCTVPAQPINVGGPGLVSVRAVAEAFGKRFGVEPTYGGEESLHCLAVNCDKALNLLDTPSIDVTKMVDWIADWMERDQESYGLPSKFEVRTGVF